MCGLAWSATQEKTDFANCFQCIKVFLVSTSIFKISDKNLKALYMFPRHSTNFHVSSILSLPFLKHCSFPLSYFRITIAAMKRKPKQNAKPRRDFLCNDSGNQDKWERGTSNNENCRNFILKTHLFSLKKKNLLVFYVRFQLGLDTWVSFWTILIIN